MPSESPPPAADADENWLPEVQALRALAVTLVLAFHAYPKLVPGGFTGVDIFFVLSGFLITRQILKSQETGSFTFREFFNRRARRLLPAASLVLLVAAVAGYLFRPKTEHWNIVQQLVASTLYFQNWQLAVSEVDYFGSTPTLVQHFWSLSVEEQFYLFWPVLIALGFAFARRTNGSGRKASVVVLSFLTIASLFCAVYFQTTEPELTYFGTHSRAWEFAVGALLAHRRTRGSRFARFGGLSAMLAFGLLLLGALFLNEGRLFPGWALVAVVPSAIVLWFDAPTSTHLFGKVLVLRPVRYLSDISYSLYLWHWPVLVVARDLSNHPLVPLAALFLSIGLAGATNRFLENPARLTKRSTPESVRFAYGSIALFTVVQLALSAKAGADIRFARARAETLRHSGFAKPRCFGADALLNSPCTPRFGDEFTPDLLSAPSDSGFNDTKEKCVTSRKLSVVRICNFGDKSAKKHVFLVGDSHALNWAPPLRALAEELGFRLSVSIRTNCTLTLKKQKSNGDACLAWVKNVKKVIDEDDSIDVIVTSSRANKLWTKSGKYDAYETGVIGHVELWSHFVERGRKVIAIGDTPIPIPSIHECLAETHDAKKCGNARKESLRRLPEPFRTKADPIQAASKKFQSTSVIFVDPTDAFCDKDFCPAVVGNVLPYRDDNHTTKTFALTMKPLFATALQSALASP